MQFEKMHGLGNDFVIFESKQDLGIEYNKLAQRMCDRHLGIGADGLMVVLPSECADIRMRIINADGSEAEMCGNGIRCFAKYVYEHKIVNKLQFTVETLAGIMIPLLTIEKDSVVQITVDMGEPIFNPEHIPVKLNANPVLDQSLECGNERVEISSVLMGVPHTVLFEKELSAERVMVLGPQIEKHAIFPQKTNVNFAVVHHRDEISVQTWERGAGMTLACGTGSCAAVVIGALTERIDCCALVHLREGDLRIEWEKKTNHVLMTGPAVTVFSGEWLL